MRVRRLPLVVLALFLLGGLMHAPLHAAEQHDDDCALQLFSDSPSVAAATMPALQLPAPLLLARACNAADRSAGDQLCCIVPIRGPPRS